MGVLGSREKPGLEASTGSHQQVGTGEIISVCRLRPKGTAAPEVKEIRGASREDRAEQSP